MPATLAERTHDDAVATVTELLVDPLVYGELQRIAGRHLRRERRCPTLEPAVLVHEAYLRLAETRVEWRSLTQFFGLVRRLMRQILIDHARRRGAAKRGGNVRTVSIDGTEAAAPPHVDVLGLHEALDRLAREYPERARVVELRYYGGFTIEETARTLARSPATVKREWSQAREWLRRQLSAAAEG